MAHSITIPFFAFKLHFHSGGNILFPIHSPESIRVKHSIQKIAKSYGKVLQKQIVDKGEYVHLLNEWQNGDFLKSHLKVSFDADKEGLSFPAFELEFDYYYKESEHGYWGLIPALSMEIFANDIDDLEESLEKAIQQEFKLNKRLDEVQGIIAAMWYDSVELLRSDITLKFHSLAELDSLEEHQKDLWLPRVATLIKVEEQETFGRVNEMKRLVRAINGNFSRNVLLIGTSGVGKTALLKELIYQKHDFRGQIWETSASILIKELTQSTGWQDNIAYLVKELTLQGDILFIRNLLELFEVGRYEGNSISIAEYLLTYIARGEVSIITECTEEEKAIIELKSPNFLSNFQLITLVEPQEDLENIILKKVNSIAKKNKVEIDNEAIQETIRLNKRFTPYSGFPGKPIRFLESIILDQKESSDHETANKISRSEVISHFCEEAGMPLFMVDPQIPMFPAKIKAQFNSEVYGQEPAVDGVVNMLTAVKTGLSKTGKPIASFLFVGPTGVGKTELAKVLSNFMFGSRNRMVRFDMSEFSSYDAVSKLIGQGQYVDGLLTSTVRREPFCVLLFDEVEKAHRDFFDLLLQILDAGRLTDSRGKLVNFCSTIIIMTSNIGAAAMQRREIMTNEANKKKEMAGRYLRAVQEQLRPELYNRIDEVIPFAALNEETVRYVVEREINQFKKREGIRYRRMDLNIEEAVFDYLAKVGFDAKYGARYLQRTLREKLVIPLSRTLNIFDLDDQLMVNISVKKKQIVIDADADPLGIDLLFEEIEKNDYADLAGQYRRSFQRFQEGYLFTQLMSDLDILKRQKDKMEQKFWNEKTRAKKYSNLLHLQSEIKTHATKIEKLEANYSLACMDLMVYELDWSLQMEAWKDKFFDIKVETLLLSDATHRNCRFRIYGENLELLINYYIPLFKQKGFDFIGQTIWYREDYFSEMIEVENKKGKSSYKLREEYFLRNWEESDKKNLIPEKPKDKLLGIEFLLVGNCPNLYLEKEAGQQKWKISDKEEYLYKIDVAKLNDALPKGAHKNSFFDNKTPFRTVTSKSIEDKNYGLKREVNRNGLLNLMIPLMDAQYKLNINLKIN